MKKPTPLALAAALACNVLPTWAQTAAPGKPDVTLGTVTVDASADASAAGLSPAFAGGQVARGGRAGILGTRDFLETPFSITSYTNELIQEQQARSVGDVLLNDPGVRVARGFGNFQEAYFIRGFILTSDDIAFNGLYSILPRQYIAADLFERVEVLRGASTFLTGATPGGGGLGGTLNLLPKRATNEPLNRVTVGVDSGGQGRVAADLSRRFGPDNATGIRINLAGRDGGTSVDGEKSSLALAAVGLDWRSRDVRLSADLGYQDNRLKATRPNVSLDTSLASVPSAPDASRNFAQPWTFSNERDAFGTLRGEWDLRPDLTAWAAYGLRRSDESNSLAVMTVTNATTGDATQFRFDNKRKDRIDTGEVGLRWTARTGSIGHEVVASASRFSGRSDTAFNFGSSFATNLYHPVFVPAPTIADVPALARTGDTQLASYAIGDTLSLLDDRLKVTAGLRHQDLDITSFGAHYDRSRNSPALAAVWRASKQVSLYANYIEGLTQGDTAPSTASNPGQQLAPFVAKQREVGVKVDSGKIGGSLALFSTTRPRAFVDAGNVFTEGGRDRHRGVELEVFGLARRDLRLLGGLTWLDAVQLETGSAGTDGRRVIGVPRVQANVGAQWDVPGAKGLAAEGRVVYTGSSYADGANQQRVPGWTRLDLGARYLTEIAGRLVTLRGRVDNVFDRNYWASSGGFPGAGYLVVGAPRTLTVSASVDF